MKNLINIIFSYENYLYKYRIFQIASYLRRSSQMVSVNILVSCLISPDLSGVDIAYMSNLRKKEVFFMIFWPVFCKIFFMIYVP